MGRRVNYYKILLFVVQLFCSGKSTITKMEEALAYTKIEDHKGVKQKDNVPIKSTQLDITTPITTVPTITTPSSPILNPTSKPEGSASNTPMATPTTMSSPGKSWCIAAQGASQTELQVALDYACGYGGAECSALQPGGSCYNPNTLHDHASYAFNSYYQKNPLPNSCNFAGTAVITSSDPSTRTCQYPSTSTSSSVLNTTNSGGATVFGGVPRKPTPTSEAVIIQSIRSSIYLHFSMVMLWLMAKLSYFSS